MSYTPTLWNTGDIITANKLNNIENGIVNNEDFVVTLTYVDVTPDYMGSRYISNKTIEEVADAIQNNKRIVWVRTDEYEDTLVRLSNTVYSESDNVIYASGSNPVLAQFDTMPDYVKEDVIFSGQEFAYLYMSGDTNDNVTVDVYSSQTTSPLIYSPFIVILKENNQWEIEEGYDFQTVYYMVSSNGTNESVRCLPCVVIHDLDNVLLYPTNHVYNDSLAIQFSGSIYQNNKIITYVAIFNPDDSIQVFKTEQSATEI